jgi:hypothetical protein
MVVHVFEKLGVGRHGFELRFFILNSLNAIIIVVNLRMAFC